MSQLHDTGVYNNVRNRAPGPVGVRRNYCWWMEGGSVASGWRRECVAISRREGCVCVCVTGRREGYSQQG